MAHFPADARYALPVALFGAPTGQSGCAGKAARHSSDRRLRTARSEESRWVVGFEVILGAYSPLSIAAMSPVSLVS